MRHTSNLLLLSTGSRAQAQIIPFAFFKRNNSGGSPGGPTTGLWVWGRAANGRLGNNTAAPNLSSPVQIGSSSSWVSIGGGVKHSLAVRSDNTLWAWGDASHGRLGNGTTTPNISSPIQIAGTWKSVSAGDHGSCGIRSDDTLWLWGRNQFGSIGDNSTTTRTSPVQVLGGGTWSQAHTNGRSTFAIKTDGTLWGWGENGYGELGVNDTIDRSSPVQISGSWQMVTTGAAYYGGFSLGIKTDGTLWAWGENYIGVLGLGDSTNRSSPTQILGSWSQVAAANLGYDPHAIGIKSDGTLWTWGGNSLGQLGTNNTTATNSPTAVSGGGSWLSVGAGYYTSFAIRNDDTLWAWGGGSTGRLGINATSNRSTPTQVDGSWSQISVGAFHSLAVKKE